MRYVQMFKAKGPSSSVANIFLNNIFRGRRKRFHTNGERPLIEPGAGLGGRRPMTLLFLW